MPTLPNSGKAIRVKWWQILGTLGCLVLTAAAGRGRPRSPAFFFIQMSDPQFGMFTADSSFAQETANFELAIATANRLHPAFVVITGDLTNRGGDPAQAAEFHRIAGRLDRSIPLYDVPGNHDVGNTPTPATLARYTALFGPDHYTFRHGDFTGIVLDSPVIDSSRLVPTAAAEQERWLTDELARARREGARHIVIFQHHPYFLKSATEADQYFNIPRDVRERYLALFHRFGVAAVFAGHLHQNSLASDGSLAMVTTGAVGMPLGGAESGMRIVTVTDTSIVHSYYTLGELPARVPLP